MNFSTLADDLNATADICDNIITTDQKDQLGALSQTIEYLQSVIQQKDKIITDLKNNIDVIEENTNNFLSFLLENSDDEERTELINNLQEEVNYEAKYSSLFQLLNIDYTSIKKDKDVIERLRAQLFGHALLLVRISTQAEYRNLLLMDEMPENAEINSQTKDIIFEMAQRTDNLIRQVSRSEVNPTPYGSIANVLGCEIDLNERITVIKEFLEQEDIEKKELQDMLLQEATITSILTNYSNQLIEKMGELAANNKDQLKGFKHRDMEMKQALQPVFDKLCKAFGQNNLEFSFESLIDKSEQLADDLIMARERAGIAEGLFTNYVDLCDRAIYKLSKRLKVTQRLLSRQTEQIAKGASGNEGVWVKWAQNLYAGLMGFENKPPNDVDLRVAIEEACLTSVGNRKIVDRVNSLRKQKKLMGKIPEKIEKPSSMKSMICTTIFAKRVAKASGHSPAY